MKNIIKIVFVAIMAISQACTDDSNEMNPSDGMIEVASVAVPDTDYKVIMHIEEGSTLEVGYNKFSLGLYDQNNNWISNAHLSITPMMDMFDMDMMHSAPHEAEAHEVNAEMLQTFATVFVMPSTAGDWTLKVRFMDMDADFQGEVSLPVTVTTPELTRMKSVMYNDTKYFITMINNPDFAVASNDLEFTIHKKTSMMDWPAVENLSIEIEPEMPAMGHGSPNNLNPVHTENGHYEGKVNFTMTGDWVINFVIKDGDYEVLSDSFEVVL